MREVLRGIFCIEGEWDGDLRRRLSVRPVLELLEHLEVAQWIHRDAATRTEVEYYLDKWTSDDYSEFNVLWLAMHGTGEYVCFNEHEDDDGILDLEELEESLKGACAGKVIYFASCSTLMVEPDRLKRFVKATGARAVIGYRNDVGWSDAAAFEVILLQELVTRVQSPGIFRRLRADHPVLSERLGLVIATKYDVFGASPAS